MILASFSTPSTTNQSTEKFICVRKVAFHAGLDGGSGAKIRFGVERAR